MVDSSDTKRTGQPTRPHIDAQAARGGEIILRTWRERWIFIAGLAGPLVVVLVAAILLLR